MTIYPVRKAQMALLLAKKVNVLVKYSDFVDVFSKKSANLLPEQIGVNEHIIELEKGKQSPYEPIYSRGPVELETLKIYIKTNLANGFITAPKSPMGAPILFIRKLNDSFYLCVNYQELNNLKIKNWYPLPLICKFLNRLDQAKRFTYLDLMSAYYWIRIKEGDE